MTRLEERIAHLELARDNACTQRDEVLARSQAARASAERRVSGLVDLVQRLCQETTEPTRAWALVRLEVILAPSAGERVAR